MWRATQQYNVLRQMLQDRITGQVAHGTNPGPKLYFRSLVDTAKAGYDKSRKQVQMIATNVRHIAITKQKSIEWFILRVCGKAAPLTLHKGGRTDCMNEETMTS